MNCVKCGQPVPEATGPGRPRLYCSTGCRRAREYELRRLQTSLEWTEAHLRYCRLERYGCTKRDAPKYEEERVRLEARLRELLDDDTTA